MTATPTNGLRIPYAIVAVMLAPVIEELIAHYAPPGHAVMVERVSALKDEAARQKRQINGMVGDIYECKALYRSIVGMKVIEDDPHTYANPKYLQDFDGERWLKGEQ